MTATDVQVPAAAPQETAEVMRVLLVEDHELMREALERRLDAAGSFRVVAGAGTVEEAKGFVAAYRPQMVLVDHSLPDGDGMDVLTAVKAADPSTVVVMLSAHDDPALIAGYLAAGANGFAHKTVAAAELLRVLRAAASGQPALDPVATQRVLEQLQEPAEPAEDNSPLSRRETEVLSLVAAGHTNDDIAARLYISPQTVKTHLSRIFGKLGVRDRASAAAKAIREGMLD